MRPIPRPLPFLLGVAVFLALVYVCARATFMENDMVLPSTRGAWKLAYFFDPLSIGIIVILSVLAPIPTLIARRCAIGSWLIFGISILASMPIFCMVDEWAGKVHPSLSDYGYLDAFILMSAFLYSAAAFMAALWDTAA